MTNYTEEVFRQVNSKKRLQSFLERFPHVLRHDLPRAGTVRKWFPRLYDFLVYPIVTRHFKTSHFGQIVPIEDIEKILAHFSSIVRLPCICRKITTGVEKRYCFGIGMDLTPVLGQTPDFRDFDRMTTADARQFIRELDQEGCTHSIWTFGTPFIGAICNCDRDCMAWRSQVQFQVARVMCKAEYVAAIDPAACTGCRLCVPRCQYDALTYDRASGKCVVNLKNCAGCGVCRPVCPRNAITLLDRHSDW
jgi:NAD-dependent dihydropyrimidine dehydrogenase PreA subunit